MRVNSGASHNASPCTFSLSPSFPLPRLPFLSFPPASPLPPPPSLCLFRHYLGWLWVPGLVTGESRPEVRCPAVSLGEDTASSNLLPQLENRVKAKWLFLGQHSTSKGSVFDKSYWGCHTIVWTHINLGFRRTPKGPRGSKTEGDGPGQGDQAEDWWKARTSWKGPPTPSKTAPSGHILFLPREAKIQILMRNVPIFKSMQMTHLRIAAHGVMSL